MSKRHHPSRPAVKHTVAERKRLRALKRRVGPSGVRRRERRLKLQPHCADHDVFSRDCAHCDMARRSSTLVAEAMAELADQMPERVKTLLDEYGEPEQYVAPIED